MYTHIMHTTTISVVYLHLCNLASSATESTMYSLTDFLSLDMKNKVIYHVCISCY